VDDCGKKRRKEKESCKEQDDNVDRAEKMEAAIKQSRKRLAKLHPQQNQHAARLGYAPESQAEDQSTE